MTRDSVNIVGAGLAGPLLAILLARRRFAVTIFERRDDPRRAAADAGRSINLALAARGILALERAGLLDRVRPLMIPMRGRMIHEPGRPPILLPYGQREDEVIYSIGRGALNRLLIDEAARQPGVILRFGEACTDAWVRRHALTVGERAAPLVPTIAADGAGSSVRSSLAAQGLLVAREEPLDHDYKELAIAPVTARHALEHHALHVWPRRGFMLIALPNTDGSFTATLFLPREGAVSFAALDRDADGAARGERAVLDFFAREFADVLPLIPDVARQYREHPQGRLGTVHAEPWHSGGEVLLLGDAAHAIVPFHGQGRFAAFEAERRPDAEAIARMAIENYGEMREAVLDPRFLRQKAWALELERRFPDRFIPRYSMVMFHPEITYAEAERRGAVQREILEALEARAGGSSALDEEYARQLIEARLDRRLRPARG